MREIEINHHCQLDQYDWPLLRSPDNNGIISVLNDQEKWELGLDAVAFKPNEIKVSIRPHETGHDLIVEGHHDARKDEHGSISRRIHRILHVPDDVDTNALVVNLYPNGLLLVKAVKKPSS